MKRIILTVALLASISLVSTASASPRLSVGQAKYWSYKSTKHYALGHYWFTQQDSYHVSSIANCRRASRLRISCVRPWGWDDAYSTRSVLCYGRVFVRLRGDGRLIYYTNPKHIRCF